MVGPSGSGKSTKAKLIQDCLEAEGNDVIIVGRDKLREMCYGFDEKTIHFHYTHEKVNIREYVISEIQSTVIKQALREGKIVIIDNTHLKVKYLKALNSFGVPVEYEVMTTSFERCVERDQQRTRTVGKEFIKKQFEQMEKLRQTFNFSSHPGILVEKVVQNPANPKAFIFDIDGTLAKMHRRSPYDMSRVKEDKLNQPVWEAYDAAKKAGFKIIICTGRGGTEQGIQNTQEWLAENDITYHEFYIRPGDSFEPDWKVKEEMWRDIIKNYFIVGMYDDRNQVVEHARKLGFAVFQVAEGNF